MKAVCAQTSAFSGKFTDDLDLASGFEIFPYYRDAF